MEIKMTAEAKFPKFETPIFFHVRDLDDNPLKKASGITVCFIPTEHGFAPGIAVCARRDNFAKKTGRAISHGRAELAWKDNQFVQASTYEDLSKLATELAAKKRDKIISRFNPKFL
jgi:hypothetical protein